MAPRKKYSSPAPETADVLTLLESIKLHYGYVAGVYIMPTSPQLLAVVCEVGKMGEGPLEPIVACEERVVASEANITGAIYRAALKAYWATSAIAQTEHDGHDGDDPF
jgi:hypothetical protein